MVKVHLVDGTYELYRAYFGAPSVISKDGQEIGAVRGLERTLLALKKQSDVTHVAVAFDTVIESFRNRLFDGYKTGENIEPELWAQFPLAERAIRDLGIVCWSMVEFEADDALATGAARYGSLDEVSQVVICSPDKDLAQCVKDDQVIMLDRKNHKFMNEQGVVEKFGIGPESVTDYLALVGDSADGIPGVPRWGAKSAATVLARFKHFEAIPSDPAAWNFKVRGAASLSEQLETHRQEAALYKQLATLRTDVPLQEELEALRVH